MKLWGHSNENSAKESLTSIQLAKSDCKALWAVLWRMMLLTPFVMFCGSILLLVVLVMPFIVPLYAILEVYAGEYLQASIAAGVWLVWLPFRKRIRRLALEGWEHASL
jgi:hypothetical protein